MIPHVKYGATSMMPQPRLKLVVPGQCPAGAKTFLTSMYSGRERPEAKGEPSEAIILRCAINKHVLWALSDFLLIMPSLVGQAPAPSSAEQLQQLTAQLRQSPSDQALWEKIIALALTINPKGPRNNKFPLIGLTPTSRATQ